MIDMSKYAKRSRVEGEFLVTGYNQSEKKLYKEVDFTYDLGYVLGSYLSVGTVNIVTYKHSTRGIVFWYVPKNFGLDKIDKLKHSLKNAFYLDLTVREQKKSSTFQLVCYSKPLATFLSEFGEKSGKKKFPQFYFDLSNSEYKKGLLSSLEDFHGYKPDTRDVLKKRKLNVEVVELYNTLKKG